MAFSQEKAIVEWDKKVCDLGQIFPKKETIISENFQFKVKGEIPFIIYKSSVSCGCVSVEFPKYPIKPGETGKITVHYDSKNQEGHFDKRIFLETNEKKGVSVIRIKGFVKQ